MAEILRESLDLHMQADACSTALQPQLLQDAMLARQGESLVMDTSSSLMSFVAFCYLSIACLCLLAVAAELGCTLVCLHI